MKSKYSIKAHFRGETPLWFAFWVTCLLGLFILQLLTFLFMKLFGEAAMIRSVAVLPIILVVFNSYGVLSLYLVWKCRRNSDSGGMLWWGEFLPKYFLVFGGITVVMIAINRFLG